MTTAQHSEIRFAIRAMVFIRLAIKYSSPSVHIRMSLHYETLGNSSWDLNRYSMRTESAVHTKGGWIYHRGYECTNLCHWWTEKGGELDRDGSLHGRI